MTCSFNGTGAGGTAVDSLATAAEFGVSSVLVIDVELDAASGFAAAVVGAAPAEVVVPVFTSNDEAGLTLAGAAAGFGFRIVNLFTAGGAASGRDLALTCNGWLCV